MFKIYKYSQNKALHIMQYFNEKPNLQIDFSNASIQFTLIENTNDYFNQKIWNFEPNSKDYHISFNKEKVSQTMNLRYSTKSFSVSFDAICSEGKGTQSKVNKLQIQFDNMYRFFMDVNLMDKYNDTEYIFVLDKEMVTVYEFVEELHNQFVLMHDSSNK